MESQKNRKKEGLIWVLIIAFLIGMLIFFSWFFFLRFEESTDDAYVHGNLLRINSEIPGRVVAIYVEDTDYVEEGQLLAQLDPTNFQLALDKSEQLLGEAVRQVLAMDLKVEELKAERLVKEIELIRAEQDFQHRTPLLSRGAVSREEFEHSEYHFASAKASLQATEALLKEAILKSKCSSLRTHPLVMKAAAEVKQALLNVRRCQIIAPKSGYIAMRNIQLGELIEPSQALLALIPLTDLWVNANFKEVQLSNMRLGQKVTLRSDLYGSKKVFEGRVVGITPGTGNTFSLLPPQNATGNWIKIVQRVPVRIQLLPRELDSFPLWLGLSMKATVDIRDQQGAILKESVRLSPMQRTSLYEKQMEGADELINRIIEENGGL